jgi:hypothetical protein
MFTATSALGALVLSAPVSSPVGAPPTNVETDSFTNTTGSCKVTIQNFTANSRAVTVALSIPTGVGLTPYVWITVQPLAPFVF